jgi:hypothetical protein
MVSRPKARNMTGGTVYKDRELAMISMTTVGRIWIACVVSVAVQAADFVTVPGFTPPAPGEHPRLLLRKADVPALRERAATPEGKAIVARLKVLLGGGEAVPAERNTGKSYDSPFDGKIGSFTLWHAAGFGALYQITGEAKYAALAKECCDLAWSGVRDRDSRYCLYPPAEHMRSGPALSAMAMAYDLCYDGWDAAYRESFAKRLMEWSGTCQKKGGSVSLEILALRPLSPNRVSNHFGLQVGGAGLCLLALKGDPGVDGAKVDQWQAGVFKAARKVLNEDFGEGGYFGEHAGPGVISMTWTFTPWLRAERIAGGRDWLSTNPSAEWMTLRFPMQMVANGSQPRYCNPFWATGPGDEAHGYGMEVVPQDGGHHAAIFCQGFGAVRPEYRPALLWAYYTSVAPYEAKRFPGQAPQGGLPAFDVFTYPHRALSALVNWPFGVEPQNPGEVLPPVAQDRRYGQYVHRNRWQDNDDIVVSALYGARSKGSEGTSHRLMILAFAKRIAFSTVTGKEGCDNGYTAAGDGSGVSWGNGNAVGVDFSKSSGADAVVIHIGPSGSTAIEGENGSEFKATSLNLGGSTLNILTITKGTHPKPEIAGDSVKIGGQTITVKEGKPVFAVIAGPWKGPQFRSGDALVAKTSAKPAELAKASGKPDAAKIAGKPDAGKPAQGGARDLRKARAVENTWNRTLAGRLQSSLTSASRGIDAEIAMAGGMTTISAVDASGAVTFRAKGAQLSMPIGSLTAGDRANLAVASARAGEPADAALASYFLLLAGRDAATWLAKAGAQADTVKALFAP